MKHKSKALFFGLSILALSWLLTENFQSSRNTPIKNGRWTNGKLEVAKRLPGVGPFMRYLAGFAENRLNLGSCQGLNEVLYREKVDLSEVSFDFRMEEPGCLAFEFFKTESSFQGVRLCNDSIMTNIIFQATTEGEFLKNKIIDEFTTPEALKFKKNKFSANFLQNGEVTFFFNGQPFAKETVERPVGKSEFGFRGDTSQASIYDVDFKVLGSSGTIHEDFKNRRHYALHFILMLSLVLAINWALIKKLDQDWVASLLNWNLLLILCASLFYQYEFRNKSHQTEQDPVEHILLGNPGPLKFKGAPYETEDEVAKRVASETTHQEGAYRILILGSSQTWGSGALRTEDTLSNQLQEMLSGGGKRFQVINSSVTGSDSSKILKAYSEKWIKLAPKIAIVDLSYGAKNQDLFRSNLKALITLNLEHQIKTVLLMEPHYFRGTHLAYLDDNYKTIKELGETYGIQVIDLNTALQKYNDSGFLWWDEEHLTSYGQKLAAEQVFREVKESPYKPQARYHQ